MVSIFGGGFDAPQTPLITWGDKYSVEESKVPDPDLVDTSDIGGNNPHGNMGCSDVMQAITQTQRGDTDAQDWDAEVLNRVLVHVLNKEQVDACATNDFTVFVITNRIDNMRLLFSMLEDDFKSMGYYIDFKTFCTLQVLNKIHN